MFFFTPVIWMSSFLKCLFKSFCVCVWFFLLLLFKSFDYFFFLNWKYSYFGLPCSLVVKNPLAYIGDTGLIPGLARSLEKEMATHSSILTWEIPLDRGAWWATVHKVTKSRT